MVVVGTWTRVVLTVLAFGGCADDPPAKDNFDLYKCKDTSTDLPNGNHNPGLDCMGACHDHGFTAAGTVIISAENRMPAVGATVTMRDADLKLINMITASNGNFYTKEPFKLPMRVWVSSCPEVQLMPDYVDTIEINGTKIDKPSCNQGVCHNNEAGTGPITLIQ